MVGIVVDVRTPAKRVLLIQCYSSILIDQTSSTQERGCLYESDCRKGRSEA